MRTPEQEKILQELLRKKAETEAADTAASKAKTMSNSIVDKIQKAGGYVKKGFGNMDHSKAVETLSKMPIPNTKLDFFGKLRGKLKPSMGGLAALAVGTGAAFLPKDSMASNIVKPIDRALTEGDPTDLITGGAEVGRGSDAADNELQNQRIQDEQQRRQADIDQRQAVVDMAKRLGGPADVNPMQSMQMVGEQPQPNLIGSERNQAQAFQGLRNRVKGDDSRMMPKPMPFVPDRMLESEKRDLNKEPLAEKSKRFKTLIDSLKKQ